MVMHARKYPRLDDGYYDRGQGHAYEDKTPSKSRSSKYDGKDSPAYRGHRDDSPSRPSPRYQNKSSYSERDKDRLKRLASASPGDKRVNHAASSSHRLGSASSSHKNGKGSRDQRTSSGDHKSEIQKTALQVCGDWSEHRSSSGKKYYYNCKTEESQWVKPKDWVDRPTSRTDVGRRDGRDKESLKGAEDRHKHSSSSSSGGVDKYSRYSDRYSSSTSDKNRQSSHKLQQKGSWDAHKDRSSSKSKERISDHRSDHQVDRYNDRHHTDKNKYTASNSKVTTPSRSSYSNAAAAGGNGHTPRQSSVQVLSRTSLQDERSRQSAGGEDMDISPGSTPTEESMSEKLHRGAVGVTPPSSTSVPVTPVTPSTPGPVANPVLGVVALLPGLLNQLGDNTMTRINSQQLTQQAISTLQKLQEALQAQQRQQQQQLFQLLQQQLSSQQQQLQQAPSTPTSTIAGSSHPTVSGAGQHTTMSSSAPHTMSTPHNQQNGGQSPESEGTPLQSPELNLPDSASDGATLRPKYVGTREDRSPTSDHSRSRRDSPTLNQSNIGIRSSKPDTITLPAQLANYYDERLITHVSSWIDEGRSLERAADRLNEEGHHIGSLGTQVSCDLKRARSWVRKSEIQSTLQEQRIYFLRQSIKDLESLRSQNTFMPNDT